MRTADASRPRPGKSWPTPTRLSVFRSISTADLADLVARQLLRWDAGRIAGFAEKTIEASGRHYPEQQQFVFVRGEAVPRVLRNEDRSALLDRVADIIQGEYPASLQHMEGLLI